MSTQEKAFSDPQLRSDGQFEKLLLRTRTKRPLSVNSLFSAVFVTAFKEYIQLFLDFSICHLLCQYFFLKNYLKLIFHKMPEYTKI